MPCQRPAALNKSDNSTRRQWNRAVGDLVRARRARARVCRSVSAALVPNTAPNRRWGSAA